MRFRRCLSMVFLTLGVAILGCAFGEIHWSDPLNRNYTLQKSQQRYTELVRWSEFQKASAFVDPKLRDPYLQQAPSLRELRFTDYESGSVVIDDETGTSTVEVTYLAYSPWSPIETEIIETQEWYRSNISNNWRVRSSFDGLDKLGLERSGR
ncbi:MAG: hypothetical protein V3T33_08215 [Myxococcota bacterium]